MEEGYFERTFWRQTLSAALTSIVIFFVLLLVVAPIIIDFMNFIGPYLIPQRFGSGRVDDGGIIAVLIRSIIISGLCAIIALSQALRFFENSNVKLVSITFSLAILIWGGFVSYAGFLVGETAFSVGFLLMAVAPPLAVAFYIWRDNGNSL